MCFSSVPKTGTGDRWHAVPAGVCHHLRDQINPTLHVLICIQLNPSIKNSTTHADLASFPPGSGSLTERPRTAPAHTAVAARLGRADKTIPW